MRSSVRFRLSPPWVLGCLARVSATAAGPVSGIRISRVCREQGPSPAPCEIDIVKRECGRWGSESWSLMVMFGKQGDGAREGSVTGLFVTVCVVSVSYGCRSRADIDHESDQVP